jgi:hypothetical protein
VADKVSWRERRKAAKRAKAERTGDTPEKRADEKRESAPDAKTAAGGAAIGGSVAAPTGIGGVASGGF